MMNEVTFLTHLAKMINFMTCFHNQSGVFFQIKFHPGMKFNSFHPGMKLTCKQNFFHHGTSFIPGWDFILVTCKRTLKSSFRSQEISIFVFAFRGCLHVKIHPGMKLVPGRNHPCRSWNVSYCLHVFAEMKFHPGIKFTCKHNFFHPGMRFHLGCM